jgi:hypothetical protein
MYGLRPVSHPPHPRWAISLHSSVSTPQDSIGYVPCSPLALPLLPHCIEVKAFSDLTRATQSPLRLDGRCQADVRSL